jgi:hypothetical protein
MIPADPGHASKPAASEASQTSAELLDKKLRRFTTSCCRASISIEDDFLIFGAQRIGKESPRLAIRGNFHQDGFLFEVLDMRIVCRALRRDPKSA